MDKKAILAKLCADAPTNEIRNCLRNYDITHTYNELTKTFRKSSLSAELLVHTLEYLKTPNMRNDLSDYTKEGLAKNLISRIQTLFPDTCLICNSEFVVDKDYQVTLPCESCGQEAHPGCLRELLGNPEEDMTQDFVKRLVNPLNLPGWSYNCLQCKEKLIPSPDSYVKAAVLKREQKANHPQQQETADTGQPMDVDQGQQITATVANSADASTTDAETGITDADSADTENGTTTDTPPVEDGQDNNNNNRRFPPSHPSSFPNTCANYLKAACTKGQSCEAEHPRICQKLLDHGPRGQDGCDGKECHDLHPKLCSGSLKWRKCRKKKCDFYHIKGTRRSRQEGEVESTSKPRATAPVKSVGKQKGKETDFLAEVRLLESKLLEAMDLKIATMLSQLPQQNPTSLPQNPTSLPQPQATAHQSAYQNQPQQQVQMYPMNQLAHPQYIFQPQAQMGQFQSQGYLPAQPLQPYPLNPLSPYLYQMPRLIV